MISLALLSPLKVIGTDSIERLLVLELSWNALPPIDLDFWQTDSVL